MNREGFTWTPTRRYAHAALSSLPAPTSAPSIPPDTLPLVRVGNRAVGFGPMRYAVASADAAHGNPMRRDFAGAMGLDDLTPLRGAPQSDDDLSGQGMAVPLPADIVGSARTARLRWLACAMPCLPWGRRFARIEACLHAVQAPAPATRWAAVGQQDRADEGAPIGVTDRLARFAALRDVCASSYASRFMVTPLIRYEQRTTRHDEPYCLEKLSFALRVDDVELYREALPYTSPQSVFKFNAAVAAAGLSVQSGLMLQARVLKHKMLSEICRSHHPLDTSRLTELDTQLQAIGAMHELAYAPTAALMQQLCVLATMLKDQRVWTHVACDSRPSASGDPEGFHIDVTMQIPTDTPLYWLASPATCPPSHATVPLFTVTLSPAQRYELPSILRSTIAIMTLMPRDRDDIPWQVADFLDGLQPPLTDRERRAVLDHDDGAGVRTVR